MISQMNIRTFLLSFSLLVGLWSLVPQSLMAQQYQFGFLSYGNLLRSLPEYKEAQEALQALKKKYEEEAQYNENKFKRLFADYLQGQKSFPEQIMLKRQKELQEAMEQGISFRKDAQKLLDNAEIELMKPIQAKLDSVLYLVGKENGLLFIGNLDNHGFPFVHSASGVDITNVVLARLNGKVIPVNLAEGVKNNLDTIPSESKEVIAEDKQTAVKETEK